MTHNDGDATVTAATGSITVTHGLAVTPQRVLITPKEDYGTVRFWVTSIGASTFTIAMNTNPASDIDFMWEAYSYK